MTEKTFQKYKAIIDEWFLNKENGRKAWQKFNPKATDSSSDTNFSRMLKIAKVSEYVESKRIKTSEKSQITFESRLNKLEELMNLSELSERYSDAINAIKEQNKMLGHYEENNKQKNSPDFIVFDARKK